MIDISNLRQEPNIYRDNLKKRGSDIKIESILQLDITWREHQTQVQQLQEKKNKIAQQIPLAKKNNENVQNLINEGNKIKEKLSILQTEERAAYDQLKFQLSCLPNILDNDIPEGVTEKDNKQIRQWGKKREMSFKPLFHHNIGENLGYMDFENARRISGTRFVFLTKDLALMERALINFMLDVHTNEHEYTEVSPPYLVNSQTLYGTSQLPKFATDQFKTEDGRWLIPTAEVPLTNIVGHTIHEENIFPLRFVAHTPCFRSEAGAAGKDTTGMIRQHQFHKVELVSIVLPDQSRNEHERMTKAAEVILQKLNLHYRVVLLCSGDTSAASCRTYDLEVWLPGANRYVEISSCSYFADYQSRRMMARYKTKNHQQGSPLPFVHTMNGSGLAVGRTLVAILENYQEENGSVSIPKVLQPYMNGIKKILPL